MGKLTIDLVMAVDLVVEEICAEYGRPQSESEDMDLRTAVSAAIQSASTKPAGKPTFLSQALNEGNGTYKP